MVKKKYFFGVFLFVSFLFIESFLSASPTITFESPTPSNTSLASSPVTIVANISDSAGGNTSSWMDFDRSLVGYWAMDYYNATGVYDNSTYNNFVKFNGAWNYSNPVTGMRGNARKFNGINDYLSINNSASLNSIGCYNTISMWLKPTGALYSYEMYISKYYAGANDLGFDFALYSDGRAIIMYRNSTAPTSDILTTNTVFSLNAWVNLVVVQNGSSVVYIYKNGTLLESLTGEPCMVNPTAYPLTIGDRGTGLFFNGSIDEVMIFNRSLSSTEVKTLYDSKSNKFNTSAMNLANGQHNYTVYSINQSGNTSDSGWRYFTVGTDTTPPTYIQVSTNNTIAGQITNFPINVTDNVALHPNGQYIFSTNNTGTWVNETAVNFTSTPSWANVTKTLNSTGGTFVGYRWYFDDNAGNTNSTPIYVLTTTIAFSATWNTSATSSGSTNTSMIDLPLEAGGTYNFVVDWGDGNSDTITTWNDPKTNHTYTTPGVYTVNITGTISGFRFNNVGDKLKINNINSWGVLNVGNNGTYFSGCSNLNSTATDNLNLTGTTSLSGMFMTATIFNGNISGWNTQNVTDMNDVFRGANAFNSDISNWNTGNVTFMNSMFRYALVFNQNISGWDIRKVSNTGYMFYQAFAFNQSLSNWNTSNVNNMNNMFYSATSFNGNISNWNTGSVTDMSSMFNGATVFNGNISNWNTSSVNNMVAMFQSASAFNQNISNWNTSKVTNMGGMFESATSFNGNISNWNTSSVTNMYYMFQFASSFNQNISGWNTGKVTDMSYMFWGATSFNQNLSSWNTSNVADMSYIFYNATSFNGNISNWNTGKVIYMNWMFGYATSFNQNLSSWNTSNVTGMYAMFYNATSFNQNLNSWNTSKVADMAWMFYNATSFNQNISNWNTGNVTYMYYMFYNATSFNQNISNWNTGKVTEMGYMFNGATAFNQNISGWNVSSVTNMSYMFYKATSFNQNLSNWNVSHLSDATNMFSGVTLSTANYNALLIGWASRTPVLTNNTIFSGGNSKYTSAATNARNTILIGFHNWTITDGGLEGDTTPPYFTTIPANASLFYANQSLLVTFVATDAVGFGYYKINDTRFSINQTGFLSNATPMGVGNYEINVTINDTSNNINWTRYRVQVNKSNYLSCQVYFNATSPITYPSNFIVYTNCSSAYTLYRNGTSISNASTINAGAGYYNLTVQRTDTANYTNTFDDEFFTVNDNTENCRVLFNVTSPLNYPATFLAWANCTTAFVLARNGTTITNNSVQSLAIGAYNFSMSRNDSVNYSIIFNQSQFIINSAGDTTPPIITFLSPTPSNTSSTSSPVTIVANISDQSNTSSWIDFDRTLVGYWAMDYYNATGVFDNSTYNNFGKFNGAFNYSNPVTGARGQARRFNGINDYINVGNTTDLNNVNNITISYWINPSSLYGIFLTRGLYHNNGWYMSLNNGDGSLFIRLNNGTTHYDATSHISKISTNSWTYVTLVINNGNYVDFYFNGILDLRDTNSFIYTGSTSQNFLIGAYTTSGQYSLNGSLDEVMIFNRSLSATEISALYDSQSNKFNTSSMSLASGQHNYTVYAIDQLGNANNSGWNYFTIPGADTTPPTYSQVSTNNTYAGQITNFSINVTDNVALQPNGQYIFSTNNTGVWVNDSSVNFTAISQIVSVAKTLNSTAGTFVGYRWYFDDNAGNTNSTPIYVLTTILNCGALSTAGATYTLTSNVTSTGMCFNITADNVTLDCNGYTITHGTGGADDSYGVRVENRFNSTIKNCRIIHGYDPASYFYGSSRPISLEGSNNCTIINNWVNGTDSAGIHLSDSNYNTITNNTGISKWNQGIRLSLSSSYNTLTNNTGMSYDDVSVGNEGITMSEGSNYNLLINNTAIAGTLNFNGRGIYIENSSYNVLINTNTSGYFGLLLINGSYNNITDCIYVSGSNSDVNITTAGGGSASGSSGNIFLNCTYTTEEVDGALNGLTRKWYYQAYANYTNGSAASGANITATNATGRIQFTGLTDGTGWISEQNITDYVNTGGTKVYYSNYTINASKTGYLTDTNIFNFTIQQNKVNDFFTLTSGGDTTPPTITFEGPPTPINASSNSSSPVTIVANISDASNTSSFIDFDRSLLLWLSFNGNSLDNSSYNWSTTNGGVTYGSGEFGQSAKGFSSTNEINVNSSLDYASGNMTISFWMYVNNTAQPKRQNPIGKAYGGDGTFTLEPDGTINFYFGSAGADTTPYTQDTSGNSATNGTWEYWAITRDRTSRVVQWYKNGVASGSPYTYSSTYDPVHSTNNLTIGSNYAGSLNGSIDEVMIFNRTLSSTEISALYDSKSNKFNTSAMTLASGQHNYTVYAIDQLGNAANSGWNYFTIAGGDTTPPTITFLSPTPSNTSSTASPVTIVANISDASNTSSFIDLDRSLLGYWAMDYYNATGIYDNSTYNNFITFPSGTGLNYSNLTTGARGDALNFDGVNDYLNVSTLSNTNFPQNAGSIALWVYGNFTSQNIKSIFDDYSATRNHIFIRSHSAASGIQVAFQQPSGYAAETTLALRGNEWNFVVVTYNTTTDNASVYIDSIQQYTATISNASWVPNGQLVSLAGPSTYFNGSLDEVMIFNRSLSQTEISALYNSQSNKFNTSSMSLASGQHNYTVYAIDQPGNAANSGWNYFTIAGGDTTPPTYFQVSTNNTYAGQITNFGINVTDETALHPNGQYIFSTNNTGTWVNETAVNFTSTPSWANVTKTLNSTGGTFVGYRWYFDDNAGNTNSTPIYVLTTAQDCGTLSTAGQTYTLTSNVTSSGTCFTISANNITLDCNDNWITYSTGGLANTYGVYTNQFNTTIENCNVLDGSNWTIGIGANRHGIYFNTNDNSTLYNNFVNVSNGNAIYVSSDANFNNLTLNTGMTNSSSGIRLYNASDNVLMNITGVSNSGYAGIYLSTASNRNTIINSICNGTGSNNGNNAGIYISSSNYNNIINSTAQGFGDGGIRMDKSQFNNISNVRAVSNTNNGLVFLNSSYNIITNITSISTTYYGMQLGRYWDGTGFSFNNTIANSTIQSQGTNSPLFLNINSTDNTFINNTIISSTQTLLYLVASANNNLFYWNNFTSTSGYYVEDYNGTNEYNVTINGKNEGNIWWNVVNGSGSLDITGDTLSGYGNGLYIGNTGSKYPYNSTNSGSKVTANVVDYAPLTLTQTSADSTPPAITFEEPPTPINASTVNSSTQTIVANISDQSNTSSFIDFDGSLVGYWAMDYYNVTGIYDNSTYNNFGRFAAGTGLNYSNLTTGARGDALMFDGVNDYINAGNSTSLNINNSVGQISSFAWVYWLGSTASGGGQILCKGQNTGYRYRINSDDTVTVLLWSNFHALQTTATIPKNTWTHIGFTSNSTGTYIYINGLLSKSDAIAYNTTNVYATNLYLGSYDSGGTGEWFNGSLDEVTLFNRSLSPTEILALYNSQSNKFNASFTNLSEGQHNYTVYAIDQLGNAANSGERNFIYSPLDTTPPTYSQVSTNNTYAGQITNFGINVTDETALHPNGQYIFSTNNTGSWVNETAVNFTSTPSWANVTKTLNSTAGTFVGYRWYFDDNAGNTNSTPIYALTTILNCGTLSTAGATYTLTSNVSSIGTCFTISANNITLDCNNYWITYSTGGADSTYGIYTNQSNTTIDNCNVFDGNRTSLNNGRYGVYLNKINNSTIFNNFVNVSNSTGLYFYNVNFSNSTNNRITSNFRDAIYIQLSSNNTLTNNTGISYLGITNLNGAGITLDNSSDNILTNNNFTGNLFRGLLISSYSSNNILINNTGTSYSSSGISLQYAYNTTLINNTAISLSVGGALYFYHSLNNTITNQTALSLSTNYAIKIQGSNNTLFRDCANITGYDEDIYCSNAEICANNTFINCSYNTSKEDISGNANNQLIREWYYQAYANYTNGSAASDVNVSAYNISNIIQFTEQTNSTGWIQRKEVIDYINTGGTRSYYNNYTINASKTGYVTDNNIWNFTTQQNKVNDFFTLTISSDITPPTITFEEPPTPINASSNSSSPVTIVANISDASNTSSFIDFDGSLVGYWAMDYYNATGIYDNSTYNNFGTFNGGLNYSNLTTGARGDALMFDGVNDYINAGNSSSLNNDINFSISVWVNPNNLGGIGYGDILGKIQFNVGGFSLGWIGNKAILFLNNSNIYRYSGAGVLNVGNWTHIVFIKTATNLDCYINGVLSDGSSTGGIPNSIGTTINDLKLGGGVYYNNYWNGSIDEVMIFNRSLSQSEISALYDSKSNKFNTSSMNLANGQHNYTVYAIDQPGNAANSGWRYFTLVTCTYSSGNWVIDCAENCTISTNVNVGGNNISITGTGTFVTSANISNYNKLSIHGTDSTHICRVRCINGGCFKS